MKPIFYLFVSFTLITTSCNKNKNNNPFDHLPPETQTGENTFGCLIDGEPFLPGGASLSGGSLNALYQNLIPSSPEGYTFGVSAKNQKENCQYKTIAFGFDSVKMKVGLFTLAERKNGKGGAAYQVFPCIQIFSEYLTNTTSTGQLNLKKFDTVNQIASGTFWFTAVNKNGDTVKVTDGRFDVRYTL